MTAKASFAPSSASARKHGGRIACCHESVCHHARIWARCPSKRRSSSRRGQSCLLPVLACCIWALFGVACSCARAEIAPLNSGNQLSHLVNPSTFSAPNAILNKRVSLAPRQSNQTQDNQDTCNDLELGDYNLQLHIASVFVQLGVSFFGCALPVVLKKWNARIPEYGYALFKHFGSGIILSTGIIHMIPPAWDMLTSDCLGDPWQSYPFFALFAMVGLVITHGMQTLLVSLLAQAVPRPTAEAIEEGVIAEVMSKTEEDIVTMEPKPALTAPCHPHPAHTSAHLHASIYALEFGVAAHSFVIGLALGTASGDEFLPLMIALVFHQLFEGIALGATVADAGFKTSFQPIFFTVCYTLSTPAGIATGIALFSSFNPNSPSNLLSVGIIEAVCGGVMIWDALVNMISTNITFGDGFYELGVWHKTGVFVALWMGAAVMAIIGYWA